MSVTKKLRFTKRRSWAFRWLRSSTRTVHPMMSTTSCRAMTTPCAPFCCMQPVSLTQCSKANLRAPKYRLARTNSSSSMRKASRSQRPVHSHRVVAAKRLRFARRRRCVGARLASLWRLARLPSRPKSWWRPKSTMSRQTLRRRSSWRVAKPRSLPSGSRRLPLVPPPLELVRRSRPELGPTTTGTATAATAATGTGTGTGNGTAE